MSKKIKYYSVNSTMGDTSSEDCEKYREWAKRQIEAEFPGHDVEVLNESSTVQIWTNDYDNESEIADFCHRLWDSCKWDFLND